MPENTLGSTDGSLNNTSITTGAEQVRMIGRSGEMGRKKLVVAVIILAVLFCGTLGGLIYVILQLQNSHAEIRDLKDEIDRVSELSDEEVGDEPEVSNSEQVVGENASASTDTPLSGSKTRYLEPDGWDVVFAYPKGVTGIEYSMVGENYDGVIYIDKIVKDGKTYDINICGGKEQYKQYPFFLGQVIRWNPTAQHESWKSSPAGYDNDLLRKVGVNEYYVNFDNPGNGCELRDDSDYLEALEIVRELYWGIEAKQ